MLRNELRLQFIHPFEISDNYRNKLVFFKSENFLFYGYLIDTFSSTNYSNSEDGEVTQIYIGVLVFDTGETYIGEFNKEFKFHGEGIFIFSIGSIIRGKFENGKIDGNAFITFPNQ